MSGYVKISRGIFEDAAFKDEPFTEREAFLWLITEASFSDREYRVGTNVVNLKRGQLAASTRFIARAWKWTDSRVRRFFDRLKNRRMIDAATDAGVTVITLCKYNEYQGDGNEADAPEIQESTQQRRTTDAKQKNERTSYTEPNGSDAGAPVDFPDARKALFDMLPHLHRATGRPESSIRSLLGKWLKKAGDDAVRLRSLIVQALEDQRADPVAWIEGCLKQSGHPKGKFVIKADGTVHKEDEHTGEWWRCYGIEPHQVEKIAIRDHRKREAA